MMSLLKNLSAVIIMAILLQSCNQGESLQHYFVDKQEEPNFLAVDMPMSMLNLEMSQLTPEQNTAYKSIQKLNMLAYKIKPDQRAEYETELSKVKTILKNSKYEELMRGGNSEMGQFSIRVLGDEDEVDEFVLFGNSEDKGFAVVRVLGNNMNPTKIVGLFSALDKAQLDNAQINQFVEFFK